MFNVAVPFALNALLMDIAVPDARLFDVKERLPVKLEAPVVAMVPPLVSAKLLTLVTVPNEKAEALPESLRVTLLVAPAVKVPPKPVTLLAALPKFVVTVSLALESVEFTVRVVAVSEPEPDSLIANAELVPSCPLTFRVAVPVAVRALLIAIAVPAATLFDVSDRLPEKLEPAVVVILPPFVSEKLCTLETAPKEKLELSPALFSVTLFVGAAAKVPENADTLLELARFAVIVSAAVESVEVMARVPVVNEPPADSLIA